MRLDIVDDARSELFVNLVVCESDIIERVVGLLDSVVWVI